jgi:hypothetical protein
LWQIIFVAEVPRRDPTADPLQPLRGLTVHAERTIYICHRLPARILRSTLRHELCEAFFPKMDHEDVYLFENLMFEAEEKLRK